MNRKRFLQSLIAGIAGLFIPLPKVPVVSKTFPYIVLSDFKARRFDIIDRKRIMALSLIQKEEDEKNFNAISKA